MAQRTKPDDEQRAHFWHVLCDEVDIRIGNYRIGTLAHGKTRVWFAIEDRKEIPASVPLDTRQDAIDYAVQATSVAVGAPAGNLTPGEALEQGREYQNFYDLTPEEAGKYIRKNLWYMKAQDAHESSS